MKLQRAALMAAGLVFASVAASNASATNLTLTNLSFSNGYSTVNVNGQNVYLGEAVFTAQSGGKTETFGAFCVDVYHDITLGSLNLAYQTSKLTTYSNGVFSGTGDPLASPLPEEIGGLVGYGLRSSDPVTQEAVQALIWEDLGASVTNFGANGAAIQSEITTLKGLNLSSSVAPNTIYAVDGKTQGFSTGVPEPTTWALMLVGFGGLGAAMRSRRKLAIA